MSAHDVLVAVTGLVWIGAGLVNLTTARIFGPNYETRVSADWKAIAFFVVIAAILVLRGASLLSPPQGVDLSNMTLNVTLTACAAFGLSVWILNGVLSERAPPPLAERLLTLLVKYNVSPAKIAAVATDPEMPAATTTLPGRVTRCSRGHRLTVLTSAGGVIFLIAALLVSAS